MTRPERDMPRKYHYAPGFRIRKYYRGRGPVIDWNSYISNPALTARKKMTI